VVGLRGNHFQVARVKGRQCAHIAHACAQQALKEERDT
jgi:hypothetical protein